MLDSIRIKSALGRSNKFDLSCDHVTTQRWFNLRPTFMHEMIPGESISVRCNSFTRCQPLKKPVYGQAFQHDRFFFVPMSSIMPSWDKFITETPYYLDGVRYNPSVPVIENSEIVDWFYSQRTLSTEVESTSAYDFTHSGDYFTFTAYGRWLRTVLQSLGYQIDFLTTSATKYSALPLLAFLRVWYDYYKSTQFPYANSILRCFDPSIGTTRTTLTWEDLNLAIAEVYKISYGRDYFTCSSLTPIRGNSPASHSGIIDTTGIPGDPITPTIVDDDITNKTPTLLPGSDNNITQNSLALLKSFTDYVVRLARAGWKDADRYLARWGVNLPQDKHDGAYYLGKHVENLNVSDVTSVADTDGANLGQYSGKAVFAGDGSNISYKTNEFGYLICVSTIIPKFGYVGGFNRHILHKDRFDFFSPEFDMAGPQAVASGELFADYSDTSTVTHNLESVFGYLPRYAEYKVGHDCLSGDFAVRSRRTTLDSWHLFRLFSESNAPLVNSESFCSAIDDQWDRIWSYNDGETSWDPFISVYHFDVTAYLPASSLFENYDFDGLRDVTIRNQGSQVN